MGDSDIHLNPDENIRSRAAVSVKNRISGSHNITKQDVIDTFPRYLDEKMDYTSINRHNITSSSIDADKVYFIKIITPRNVQIHQKATWWKNKIAKKENIGKVFKSYDSPKEMVEYEYHATQTLNQHGGSTPTPHEYDTVTSDDGSTGMILFDYISNTGYINQEKRNIAQLEYILKTLHILHEKGYTHTAIPGHIIRQHPDGQPCITDIIGRHADNDTAKLLAKGFDIAEVLAEYTAHVGALPALHVVEDIYSPEVLIPIFRTIPITKYTTTRTRPWVINHIQHSIDEMITEADINMYVDEYNDIDGESIQDQYDVLQETDTLTETNTDTDTEKTESESTTQSTTDTQSDGEDSDSGNGDNIEIGLLNDVDTTLSSKQPSSETPTTDTYSSAKDKQQETPESDTVNKFDEEHSDGNTDRPKQSTTKEYEVLEQPDDITDPDSNSNAETTTETNMFKRWVVDLLRGFTRK